MDAKAKALPLFVLVLLLSAEARSAGKTALAVKSGKALTESFVWHEGNRIRKVWLDPDYVVDFSSEKPAPEEKSKGVRAFAPSSALQLRQGKMNVWKLGASARGASAAAAINRKQPGANASPLFRAGPWSAGPMRALPGGIIVQFKADWSEQQIQQWLETRKLKVKRKLSYGTHFYLLHAEAGLPSLLLANEIHQSNEVLKASPDWTFTAVPF